ncbi:MAG: hypothetical protein ACYC19_07910, partial [Acidimicrobiales bacterium]
MSPSTRTPQQRDRRFARVRNLTMSIFVSSGVISAVFIGYAASIAKPVTATTTTPTSSTTATTTPTTPTPSTSSPAGASNVTPTTVYTPPVT